MPKNWLQTLLPQRVPNARVLLYSYQLGLGDGHFSAGVETKAMELLKSLLAARPKSYQCRRIVWVGHDIGGAVIKRVSIVNASN